MQEQEANLTTGHLDLLESLPVMILDLDGDGAVVFANQRAREGLGLGSGQLDMSIAELLDPSNKDAVLAQIRELWSGEGDITSTWKLRTRAGKVLQVDTNAISIHENSYPIRVRLYLHDGSEVVSKTSAAGQAQLVGPIEAKAALKEEREYTKALIQKSGLLVYIFDTQGTVVEINKKMEDVTGYNRQKAPTLDELLQGLYPDERYRKIVSDVHKNMFKNQHLRETELKIATRRGEVKHISWSTARLKNARGEVHGFIAAGMDVTEKKRLEHWAKLQASCLERISDGVIISDLKGDIIQWLGRSEEILGYTAEEALGKPFTQFFPDEERRHVDRLIEEDIEKAGQWKAEIELKSRVEMERPVQVEVVVVRNEGGQAIALVTLIREPGVDKEVEEQAAELERRLSDSVAQMEVFRARGDQLEVQLREDQARADNYLARADAMAAKNRDLEDEVARQAGGRAALEQAVEELSIFQLSLLGVASMSLVTTDGGGTVTNWSKGAEEFTGMIAREAMGNRLHDEVFRLEGFTWDTIVQETLDNGAFRGPATLIRNDGTTKSIILDTSVLNDQHGNAVGLTEVAIEFSGPADPSVDLALFEARSQALLGALTPNIAQSVGDHYQSLDDNLKQLISKTSALKQLVELYRRQGSLAEAESFARKVNIEAVLGSVEPAAHAAESNLAGLRTISQDLSRFLPGSVDELEILSLNEVAEVAIHLTRGSSTSARIERAYGPGATALGSANEVTRAALFVLMAASQAAPTGGTVTLKTGTEGDRVFLEASHSGAAVDEQTQALLGNPSALARADHPSVVSLGLANQIAESLGGGLKIIDGSGTQSFRLELPLAESDAAVPASDLDDAPEKPWGKVIHVETEDLQRRSFQSYFAGRFEVEPAWDIDSLKAALKTKPKAQAIVLSGTDASQQEAFYEFLHDYNKEIASKVIFLLPAGLSRAQRQTFRKTGRVMLDRPVALETLEGLLRLVVS